MTIRERALDFATNAHTGQTRWDKNVPYITHPIEVARIAEEKWRAESEGSNSKKFIDLWADCIYIVGIGHDIEEDTNFWARQYLDIFIGDFDFSYIEKMLHSLNCLNKNNYSNYLDFVLAAKNNDFARYVKLADITHNLSDTKKKGSMMDKYLLAKYILEN